jgi:hypothetical protein
MLGREELRMRRVPSGFEAAEGWRRTNRRLLPHPISHGLYCPFAPPSQPQDQPHLALGTYVLEQALNRLHALPARHPTASVRAVDQDRGVPYGLSVHGSTLFDQEFLDPLVHDHRGRFTRRL